MAFHPISCPCHKCFSSFWLKLCDQDYLKSIRGAKLCQALCRLRQAWHHSLRLTGEYEPCNVDRQVATSIEKLFIKLRHKLLCNIRAFGLSLRGKYHREMSLLILLTVDKAA